MQPSGARLCPKCSGEVREGWRACPNCLTPLPREGETKTEFGPAASSSSVEEGRFPAGTVLAGRYRISGLLGRGGMGEVYRAFDLILNQAVALKFLSQVKLNEAALVRFRNEVRIARQVSHPNVCRVYDIGVIEGLHFLSMEYLDGEDLDSLIRRIGRLPQEKAIEFARKICAGLAAAHDRGVLHRDLKPANIMIDGRGHVRITDFGLAALATEIPLSDLRSGTPAYMSPEQKTGKEVTTRSDLYSLGLVLYEMFTGKRRSSAQTNPTDLVKDLDPAVERVILRCLEEDSRRRPSSALHVAMALPGGDPVAAALAAGETPSPEMVAASGEKEGFSPRTAVLCFLGIIVGLISGAVFADKNTLLSRVRIDIPPEALAFQAQGILKQFGYTDPPRSTAYGFLCCNANHFREPGHQVHLPEGQPAIGFWYRQHQSTFSSHFFPDGALTGAITFDSPANIESGMIRLALDTKGRLIVLEVRPTAPGKVARAMQDSDWAALLTAAGLDQARFKRAAPERIPPTPFDDRFAWTGPGPEDQAGKSRPETIRVEAASWHGRPVFVDVGADIQRSGTAAAPGWASLPMIAMYLFSILCLGSAVVARSNLRLGRADRRGAARAATVVFSLAMGVWVFTAGHTAGAWEFGLLIMGLSWAGFEAACVWLVYVAVEPYVRRNWPDSLISWTRFQTGRLRNPLVASHVLAGIMFMELFIQAGEPLVRVLISGPPAPPPFLGGFNSISSLNSAAYMTGILCNAAVVGFFDAMAYLLLVVLLRRLVRRLWIADTLGAVLVGLLSLGIFGDSPHENAVAVAFGALGGYGYVWLVRRFGLLALLSTWLTATTIAAVPLSLTSWYTGRSILAQLIPVAVATWALWVILSAQRQTTSETAA